MARFCAALFAVAVLALAACGQAGDLYLPSPESETGQEAAAPDGDSNDNDREAED